MIRINQLAHAFVDAIPEQLTPGMLYIALHYKTITHLCCCGCGSEVVTPLSPAQWRITFDGEAVSLYPSVGNWNLPCRSHYIIKAGKVIEADTWSDKQIAYGQVRDKRVREAYFDNKRAPTATIVSDSPKEALDWWDRLLCHLRSKN